LNRRRVGESQQGLRQPGKTGVKESKSKEGERPESRQKGRNQRKIKAEGGRRGKGGRGGETDEKRKVLLRIQASCLHHPAIEDGIARVREYESPKTMFW